MKEYTVKVDDSGRKRWYLDGKFHREDGPAIEYGNGDKEWWLDGKQITEREHRLRRIHEGVILMPDALEAADGAILREQAERIAELEARVAALEQDEEGVLMERYWEAKLKGKNA